MARKLNISSENFSDELSQIYNNDDINHNEEISQSVSTIIKLVRKDGDQALISLTEKYDGFKVNHPDALKFSDSEIADSIKLCSKEHVEALELAKSRIVDYHNRQMPDLRYAYKDSLGCELGWRWNAVESAGLYVPGGKAAYFSTVLMNAIAANIAGVKRLVMVTPTPLGQINPLVLYAAKISGVTEIYRVGGAQSIAALAYGTDTIKRVDKIVGPGNAFVAEAKRQVFGKVGIDTIAGPSEILIIADKTANPKWVAADLLSQAEHDFMARSIVISDDQSLLDKISDEVDNYLKTLPRKDIAQKSWNKFGVIIKVDTLDQAVLIANNIAAEHLELMVAEPNKFAEKITNAGAIFSGHYTPEALGDYIAGPSHVLPTSGAARFSSGLSVMDFLKRTSLISASRDGFSALASATISMAKEEGLAAHALSVSVRMKE